MTPQSWWLLLHAGEGSAGLGGPWGQEKLQLSRAPQAPTARPHDGRPPRSITEPPAKVCLKSCHAPGQSQGWRRQGEERRPQAGREQAPCHAAGLWQGVGNGWAWHGQPAWALASRSAPAAVPRQHSGAERWAQPPPQQSSIPCQSVLVRRTPACNVTES